MITFEKIKMQSIKKTKIVATIGPGTDGAGILLEMIAAGMNVARFNFSHGTQEEHGKRMQSVRAAARENGVPVALLLDTKGPEMRLGKFVDSKAELRAGQEFLLMSENIIGNNHRATMSYPDLWKLVQTGQKLLLDDGLITLNVQTVREGEIITIVENAGTISDRKRIACPGLAIPLPALSAEDIADIHFGLQNGIDYIAASFIQNIQDVILIKRFLEEEGFEGVQVIAKIENEEGVKNLDAIIKIADGLMVARGDLGVEIPAEKVPLLQKMMIQKCNQLGKPVITATQMLESMINQPRPTRAETSDIANAIFDGTDAVMLSAETASGKYPVAAVETMSRVAMTVENSEIYRTRGQISVDMGATTTEAISHATVKVAETLTAAMIVTSSESGRTARMVSKYRPRCPIIVVSPHEKTLRRCTLYWGVLPVQGRSTTNSDDMVRSSLDKALELGYINAGDLIVLTAGVPFGKEGTTNMIRVQLAGKAILDGSGIGQARASGKVVFVRNVAEIEKFAFGNVLVIEELLPEYKEIVLQASAIIAVERGITSTAAIAAISLSIPAVVGVDQAFSLLNEGEMVTVDAGRGSIFGGIFNSC